ncbi:hypothetical protein FHG87_020080 [Trinorchestia longiramus]|nr:hypothetical protein FHG87_020080 [Trinorchestia longiramus]
MVTSYPDIVTYNDRPPEFRQSGDTAPAHSPPPPQHRHEQRSMKKVRSYTRRFKNNPIELTVPPLHFIPQPWHCFYVCPLLQDQQPYKTAYNVLLFAYIFFVSIVHEITSLKITVS